MIEVFKQIPEHARIADWLRTYVVPHMTPDVSNYAKGRMRVWLGQEPSLSAQPTNKPGLPLSSEARAGLVKLLGWGFDYALVTNSAADATGILPHRDAGFADYEALGFNVCGTCTFKYWNSRQCFGRGPVTIELSPFDPPTHVLTLNPGDVIRFNCKNLHAAYPNPDRLCINFWKRKR